MSDYRRFVSYIYLYENNVKSINAGFVKVESRNGKCRFNVSLKNVYSVAGKCKVYLFMRVGQDLKGIYMGELQIKNHGSEWNFFSDTSNVAGSGYSLNHMSGMIILSEGDKVYGTRWDQGDLDLRRFITEWKDRKEMIDIEDISTDDEIVDNEFKNIEVIEENPLEKKENDAFFVAEKELEDCSVKSDERYRILGKIMEHCPGMYPFEDDVIEACVRLEPQDIGMMPLDCWTYGSNSFLLHGYYSYRHLILARLKSDEQNTMRYILGVPGTKHSREAFMANMFGFQMFKPIRENVESAGDFGYWYTIL